MSVLQVVMFVAAPLTLALLVAAALDVLDVFRRDPKVTREEWMPVWDPRRHRNG